jgi:hypothetical protein
MKFLLHFIRPNFALFASATLLAALVPASFAADHTASVQSVCLLKEDNGAAVEIITNQPVTPQITPLDSPRRLVIDLPYSDTSLHGKRIGSHIKEIKDLRVDEYTIKPPVARIVVDLQVPMTYKVEAQGKRVLIHLQGEEHTPPTIPALTKTEQPAVVPVSPASSGGVLMDASRLVAGSSVTAGSETAILHLARGGEVRVCAGTTISVTSSKSGGELMLGLSTGALEGHYALGAAADSVVTPDFRFILGGPGEFDYAMSVNSHGDTCVRTMPGNTASVMVSELMGDGTYQIKPEEQVVFHGGQLASRSSDASMNCGCGGPKPEMLRASESPSQPVVEPSPSPVHLAQPGENESTQVAAVTAPAGRTSAGPGAAASTGVTSAPATDPNDVHVQIEAPLVFQGKAPQKQAPQENPAPTQEAAALPANTSQTKPAMPATVALPPSQPAPGKHRGFFGSIGHFFKSLF